MEVETPKESRKSNKRSYGLANRKTKGLATKVPNKKNCTSWNQDYNIDFGDVPKEDFLNNTIHATKNVAVPLKVSRKNPMYKTPKKSPLPVQVANNKRPSGTNYSTKDRVGKGVQIAKPGYTFANARTAVNSPKAGAFQLAKKSPSEYTRVANSDQKWTKLLKTKKDRIGSRPASLSLSNRKAIASTPKTIPARSPEKDALKPFNLQHDTAYMPPKRKIKKRPLVGSSAADALVITSSSESEVEALYEESNSNRVVFAMAYVGTRQFKVKGYLDYRGEDCLVLNLGNAEHRILYDEIEEAVISYAETIGSFFVIKLLKNSLGGDFLTDYNPTGIHVEKHYIVMFFKYAVTSQMELEAMQRFLNTRRVHVRGCSSYFPQTKYLTAVSEKVADKFGFKRNPINTAAERSASSNLRHSRRVQSRGLANENETYAVYPPPPENVDVIRITTADLARCQPNKFLNDNLVDLYFRVLKQTCPKEDQRDKFLCFTSHFYPRLSEATTCRRTRQVSSENIAAGYELVKSWAKDSDIFSKNAILVPINESLHWSLAIICNPRGAAERNTKFPTVIILLDSLGNYHRKEVIRQYLSGFLALEWQYRDNTTVYDTSMIQVFTPKVPCQNNGYDCGVFMLEYGRHLIENLVSRIGTCGVSSDVDRIFHPDIFESSRVANTRNMMQMYLEELHILYENRPKKVKSSSNSSKNENIMSAENASRSPSPGTDGANITMEVAHSSASELVNNSVVSQDNPTLLTASTKKWSTTPLTKTSMEAPITVHSPSTLINATYAKENAVPNVISITDSSASPIVSEVSCKQQSTTRYAINEQVLFNMVQAQTKNERFIRSLIKTIQKSYPREEWPPIREYVLELLRNLHDQELLNVNFATGSY